MVELLVVIAVLAILLAILTPNMGRAMDTAKDTTCRTNLGQLAKAGHAFTMDNGGEIPLPFSNGNSPAAAGRTWYETLFPYLGLRPNAELVAEYNSNGTTVKESIASCPVQYENIPDLDKQSKVFHGTYSANHNLTSEGHGLSHHSDRSELAPIPFGMVLGPERDGTNWSMYGGHTEIRPIMASTVPYFMDGWTGDWGWPIFHSWRHYHNDNAIPQSNATGILRSYPHRSYAGSVGVNTSCNMAFIDGHVEPMRYRNDLWTQGRQRYSDNRGDAH